MKTFKSWITKVILKLIFLFRIKRYAPKNVTLISVPIIKAGVQNSNGRVYPQDVINLMCDQIGELSHGHKNFGMMGMNHENGAVIDLSKVSHFYKNPKVDGDILRADITTMDTPLGKDLAEMLNRNRNYVVFRPSGYGTMSPTGKILNDFKLISINAIPHSEDAYRGLI